jgi:hypothetical protein
MTIVCKHKSPRKTDDYQILGNSVEFRSSVWVRGKSLIENEDLQVVDSRGYSAREMVILKAG